MCNRNLELDRKGTGALGVRGLHKSELVKGATVNG